MPQFGHTLECLSVSSSLSSSGRLNSASVAPRPTVWHLLNLAGELAGDVFSGFSGCSAWPAGELLAAIVSDLDEVVALALARWAAFTAFVVARIW